MLRNELFSTDRQLVALCGSEKRMRLIHALFERPLEPQPLGRLAKAAGSDPANALRALRKFAESGLVEVIATNTAPRYRPRRDTPVFNLLHALFSQNGFASSTSSHSRLDEHKRRIGEHLLETHTLPQIRAKSLDNLQRWRANGVWNEVYADWMDLLRFGTELALVKTMTSRDDESNRLRQSMPYVGLLDRAIVRKLNEEITA